MSSSSGSERRQHRRFPVRIPADIYLKSKPGQCIEAYILDLSIGGAFISAMAPISLGEELMLEIRFAETQLFEGRVIVAGDKTVPPENPKLTEKVIVRWARGSSSSGFGVEFRDLTAEHREFLAKVIQHLERESAAKAAVAAGGRKG